MKPDINSWESYKALIDDADMALAEVLNGQSIGMNLDGIIHNLIWHQGLCPARWITENRDLVKWLNCLKKPTTDELAMIQIKLEASIKKMKKVR